MQLKIGICGAPGTGKSTLLSGLHYLIKLLGSCNVERIEEIVKIKHFRGDDSFQPGFDVMNTMEQKELERTFDKAHSRGEIDVVITEAPLFNGYLYASFYGKERETPILREIASIALSGYDVLIFARHEDGVDYNQFGRRENAETSRQIEDYFLNEIRKLGYKGRLIETSSRSNIFRLLQEIGFSEKDVTRIRQTLMDG